MNKIFLFVMAFMLTSSMVFADTLTFKVAEGTLPSAGNEVPDPNIFLNLNNSALKPTDWNLTSPYANLGYSYAVDMSRLTLDQLLEYDLIFLTNHYPTSFSDTDRDNVEKWIAAGGTLWIDDCGNMDPSNFFLNFKFNSYENQPVSGSKWASNEDHYFFDNVYDLTINDIANLGNSGYSSSITGFDTSKWTVLVYNHGYDGVDRADMIAMNYGEGRIIVTSDDYGCAINEQGKEEDYKLAYNILKWAKEDQPVNPVPEPATMLLLGTGLAGLATRKRMKK